AAACSDTISAPRRATAAASGRISTSSDTSSGLLLVVAAELFPHGREELVRVLVEIARGETRVERRGQDRRRDADVDRRGGRPPALAGVGYASGEVLELG